MSQRIHHAQTRSQHENAARPAPGCQRDQANMAARIVDAVGVASDDAMAIVAVRESLANAQSRTPETAIKAIDPQQLTAQSGLIDRPACLGDASASRYPIQRD